LLIKAILALVDNPIFNSLKKNRKAVF